MPLSDLCESIARRLGEISESLPARKIHERIAAVRFDVFDLRLDQRMIRHGERQSRDNHVRKRFARNIHALPKTVGAEQNRIHVGFKFFQHERARRAGSLHKTFEPQLVEERLHSLRDLLHQLEIREQHERFAVRHAE